ncbi:hypothetical protein J4E86_003844 [Alternaria arbusti]|uniref:uncharacterized protein n=1 Tax=Alternaria arbusti TaxID=232088 RepID=UPI0022212482|nr:uncharacterized protein J4E86_003844 [Alternaria arbusti]KAI4958246.1 hypothetical protein J4E86_003844 [Alternaria arbusti]
MADLSREDPPPSNSPHLVIRHPTEGECRTISTNTSAEWKDSLSLAQYLEEGHLLATVPLAQDGGMTTWILVHQDQAPNERKILCSCESFSKRSLTSNTSGSVSENTVHGVASVFSPSEYRGRGYAARMMRSTLYSDIGKEYYAKLGWLPNSTNSHIELQPSVIAWPSLATPVTEDELGALCKRDEELVRSRMSIPTEEAKTRFTIIPDVDHMLWHISKEEFAAKQLFDRIPNSKGARAGPPGSQVWALWTHRYYSHPDASTSRNVLYILRLVMEVDETATRLSSEATKRPEPTVYERQIVCLRAILQAAQTEANEWDLDVVKIWDPTPLVLDLLTQSGLEYEVIERENDSIASLLWYDADGGVSDGRPLWLNNEHYAWQ